MSVSPKYPSSVAAEAVAAKGCVWALYLFPSFGAVFLSSRLRLGIRQVQKLNRRLSRDM